MATQTYIEKYAGPNLAARGVANLASFHILAAATITDLDIYVSAMFGGGWLFQWYLNGVAQFAAGSRPTVSSGALHSAKPGLSIAVVKNDVISCDFEVPGSSGYINAPIEFGVTLSDGSTGGAAALDDLTDVDTSGATTDDVLTFDGAGWIPQAPATPAAGGNFDKLFASDQPGSAPTALNGATVGTRNGLYHVTHTGTGGSTIKGAVVNLVSPSSDFTFELGISINTFVGAGPTFVPCGLFTLDSGGDYNDYVWGASGGEIARARRSNPNGAIGTYAVIISSSQNLNGAGTGLAQSKNGSVIYLRLRKVGAVYYLAYSFNGYTWFQETNISAHFTPPVVTVGMVIDESNALFGGNGCVMDATIFHWKLF